MMKKILSDDETIIQTRNVYIRMNVLQIKKWFRKKRLAYFGMESLHMTLLPIQISVQKLRTFRISGPPSLAVPSMYFTT